MDAWEFDSMDPVRKWEYFWEYGIYVDSITEKHVDYFLFRHKKIKSVYMELFMVKDSPEKGIRVISGGEALVKYYLQEGEKPSPPWE
ncbi:hypothetical protein [Flagellimonas sp.]|uniref:hypothetical protein n=1 Tax=Flagellimonas sp. TaxID=2058762 RepID=UPI003BA9AD36